ncbi:MAG: tetratricopeptide repeat-containing sensor histidine kinase [Bacteroidota bacterium]
MARIWKRCRTRISLRIGELGFAPLLPIRVFTIWVIFAGCPLSAIGQLDRDHLDVLIEKTQEVYYARPDSALSMARDALAIASSIGYEEGKLLALRWIGNSHYLMGRLDSASVYMLDLLDRAYDQGNLGVQADVMIDIGQTYDKIGMHSLAYDYFLQAHKIRIGMQNGERMTVTAINLAYHHFIRGKMDSALHYYELTQRIFDTIPTTHTTPFLYSELAAVYLKQGRFEEARVNIDSALRINEAQENYWDLATTYVTLAQLELAEGNAAAAEEAVSAAIDISVESKVSLDYDAIYQMIAQVKMSQGRYREALDYLTMSYQYADSLDLALRDQKILALDYYKREKENQIATLKLMNENDRKDSQITKQQYLLASFGVFLLLTFAAAALLYRQNGRLRLAQGKIENQNQDLKVLNSTKGKLFSIITHDIRNPLAHLNSMLKMVRNGEITREEFTEFTGLLVDHTNRLTTLSETLIDWSKSQELGLSAEKQSVDISRLIAGSVRDLSQIAKDKGINLEYSNGQPVEVNVDPTMMTLALNNLLTNAIKFTPSKGNVTVHTVLQGKYVKILIEDSGIGIDPDLIRDLRQGDVRTQRGTDNERGSGIGLMLTFDLIVLNGGELEAVKNQGRGSTFTITLPLR